MAKFPCSKGKYTFSPFHIQQTLSTFHVQKTSSFHVLMTLGHSIFFHVQQATPLYLSNPAPQIWEVTRVITQTNKKGGNRGSEKDLKGKGRGGGNGCDGMWQVESQGEISDAQKMVSPLSFFLFSVQFPRGKLGCDSAWHIYTVSPFPPLLKDKLSLFLPS